MDASLTGGTGGADRCGNGGGGGGIHGAVTFVREGTIGATLATLGVVAVDLEVGGLGGLSAGGLKTRFGFCTRRKQIFLVPFKLFFKIYIVYRILTQKGKQEKIIKF